MVVKYRPYALHILPVSLPIPHTSAFVHFCPLLALQLTHQTTRPFVPSPGGRQMRRRIPKSSCLRYTLAHHCYHCPRRRRPHSRPVHFTDTLVPIRGVCPWQPSASNSQDATEGQHVQSNASPRRIGSLSTLAVSIRFSPPIYQFASQGHCRRHDRWWQVPILASSALYIQTRYFQTLGRHSMPIKECV